MLHRMRLHRSSVIGLVIALSATAAGVGVARNLVASNEKALLRQQAAQVSLVLSSLTWGTTQVMQASAATLAKAGGNQAAVFAAGSRQLLGSGFVAAAVLEPSPTTGGYRVRVGTPGLLAAVGTAGFDRELASAVGAAALTGSGLVGFVGAGDARRIGSLVPVGKSGQLLYAETPSPVSQSRISAKDALPFTDLTFAVYLGSESESNILMTNATTLPIPGNRAAVAVSPVMTGAVSDVHVDGAPGSVSAPGGYLLVVHPTTPLSGKTAGLFPWALLVLGLLSTAGVFLLFETALRRRDHALRLVKELEERNEAVQAAMARQAEAEESLRQAQRMEAVGRLAGGIAHDFNNLLAVILTYAGFLEESLTDDARSQDVNEIKVAAQRAADLTRQLLVFSRRDVVRPTVLDLVGLLSDAERLLGRTLGEDIEVSLDAPPQVVVHADPGELHQVVMNLAVNARDAMPNGGRLELRVDVLADAQGLPETAQLVVSDTGVGMSPEVALRAFEPFFTTKEVGRGTGLGLATVYGIVDRWGGRISVDSEPGRGTTFTILLPIADQDPEATAAPESPASAGGIRRTARVLLVEDEPSVRKASRRVLESAGYDVIEAPDGIQAMAAYADNAPDIVVTDIVMPGGMSGAELATVLHEVAPHLPVVFVSGYGRDHLMTHGELPEDVVLLHKPYPGDELVAAIRSALGEVMA